MAYDPHGISDEDAEALKARRAELHEFMRELTCAAAMLPAPETYLEAQRAVRAITVADRLIQSFCIAEQSPEDAEDLGPPPLSSFRKGLRMLADRMMAAAKAIPLPNDAMTALRAARYALSCDRMLTQLYVPPKPKPFRFVDDRDDEKPVYDFRTVASLSPRELTRVHSGMTYERIKGLDPSDMRRGWADWQFELEEKLKVLAERRRQNDERPDGSPYVPEPPFEPDPPRYNPDGSVLWTLEAFNRRKAETAAKDAENPRPETSEGHGEGETGEPDPP